MLDVAIVGGGLAGLRLALQLQERGVDFQLFEARPRFGGRILGHPANAAHDFRYDLGPSWIWPDSQALIAQFIQQHDLLVYPQWCEGQSLYQSAREQQAQLFSDPTTYADARRLKGGPQRLIDSLLLRLNKAPLFLEQRLTALNDRGDHIELHLTQNEKSTQQVAARHVALMLPPRLLAQNVLFEPALSPTLVTAMQETPTWMAGHAKAVLHYEQPFWRAQGLSGSVFASYPGVILGEIFDASSDDAASAGLSGFFALPAQLRQRYQDDLEALILEQMVRLFGAPAATPIAITIHDWCTEPNTATTLDQQPLANHPHYGHPFFQHSHCNGKLYFGGTETAPAFGGYLEGALQSARFVSQKIMQSIEEKQCQTT